MAMFPTDKAHKHLFRGSCRSSAFLVDVPDQSTQEIWTNLYVSSVSIVGISKESNSLQLPSYSFGLVRLVDQKVSRASAALKSPQFSRMWINIDYVNLQGSEHNSAQAPGKGAHKHPGNRVNKVCACLVWACGPLETDSDLLLS